MSSSLFKKPSIVQKLVWDGKVPSYPMAKQTSGSKCDTGSKYELSVTALFASFLSKNENVEDYRIFSNLSDAHPFDDLVVEVHFKGSKQKQIYAVQIKAGRDKFNLDKYYNGYDKIIGEGGLKLGKNARNDRISFWYFCSKNLTKTTFSMIRNADAVDVKVQPRCRPYNLHESIFDKAVSHGLFSEDSNMADRQNFFENFYLFINQPNTDKITYIIKGIWNIDKPWLIFQYLDNYLTKNSNGLDKATFEHELLKIRLSDYIVTPTAAIAVRHQAVEEWNELTLKQDITVVQNKTHIESYLFGCILQNISYLISIEEWNHATDNLGKLDQDLKTRLKAKSFKADTLRELMFQAWVDRKTPLVLKTDTSLPFLEEFSYLKKCYVIIDSNVDRRYNEMNSYKLNTFRHLGDVDAYGLMTVIPVSLQGRKPVSLYEIINGDGKLKETITCLDIINLIKPREAHFKRECLESWDYMLFLIETADLQQREDDEHRFTGSNIAIYCGPNESVPNYTKYRSDLRFKSYKILRVRSTDDGKLKLLARIQGQCEEEYHGLECFFVDQNGESVYYMADDTIVPVIGEVPSRTGTHTGWKYVDRYLREGIVKKEAGRPSNEDASNDVSIEYSKQIITEKDFFKECGDKVNIITGEPGMGKTTLLYSLVDFCESKYYVLFVDLGRIRGDLLRGKLKSSRHLINLSRSKCQSLPYSCFLNSLHDYPKRLVLILDSFDEIVATCKQQVLELVKDIHDAGLQNVIIASRLTALNLLVDNCEAKIFKIEGFNHLNERSDKHYIGKWNLDINKLHQIPSKFLTTPLYLNMLRTLSENGTNLEDVNRWNLYESILKLKMEDYSLRNYLDEDEKGSILAKHGVLALKVIFGNNKVTEKYRVQSNNSNFVRLGFITHFDNENPTFVHRTFAEFFVVKWLIQNVGHAEAAYIYRLILDDVHRYILDVYSETIPLHEAILKRDIIEVRRLCEEDIGCVLKTDDMGRGALHLAAIVTYLTTAILNFLLPRMRNEGCDIHTRDKILKWRWIDYLEKYGDRQYRYAHFTVKEAYVSCYATHIEELEHCKYSLSENFNELYNDALHHSSISMVRDLLFLKYHKNKTLLEFREMCLGSREIQASQIELTKEKLEGVHLACIYGNIHVVRAYIGSRTKFTKTDKFNCTPLHYSVMTEQRNEIVKLLLDTYGIPNPLLGKYNGITILHISVQTGDVFITKMILEHIDDKSIEILLNKEIDIELYTPLQLAVRYGNSDMVELLLQHGANPNIYGNSQCRELPIEVAVRNRKQDIVEMLVKYGANANPERSFDSPLHCAIQTSQMEMLELLLRSGAIVNYADRSGATPLANAISRNCAKELVQMLLNYGADINLKGGDDRIPMFLAIESENLEIIELLLINKALLDCWNFRGWTPLIFAIIKGRKDIVEMLLDGINFKSKRGITPLCAAIKINNADMVQVLLDHQADVNSADEYGLSPLITAAETQGAQIAEMLLNKGADVNFKNEYGITALYAAAFKGNVAMVELLLEHRADINAITFVEEILCKAKGAKQIEIVVWLLKNRKVGHLLSASNSLATNVIEVVTENWAKINLKDELRTAVHLQPMSSDAIETLMEWGGEIDIEDEFWKTVFCLINEMTNEKADDAFFITLDESVIWRLIQEVCGATSDGNLDIIKILSRLHKCRLAYLRVAIKLGKDEIVRILLQNTDVADEALDTDCVLHGAVRSQNTNIVEMLLEHRFEADLEDYRGLTPLLIAVLIDNVAIAEILLTKGGADLHFRARRTDVTALHIAALKENRPMVKKLLEHGANKNVEISRDSLPYVTELIKSTDENFSACNVFVNIDEAKRIIEEESTGIER